MERRAYTGDFWFTVRIVDHFEKRILGNKCGPVIISETYSSSTGQIPNLQSQHKSHRKKHWHLLFLTELRSQHSHLFVEPFLSRCQQNAMKIRKLRAVQTRRVLSAAAEWTRINRTFFDLSLQTAAPWKDKSNIEAAVFRPACRESAAPRSNTGSNCPVWFQPLGCNTILVPFLCSVIFGLKIFAVSGTQLVTPATHQL